MLAFSSPVQPAAWKKFMFCSALCASSFCLQAAPASFADAVHHGNNSSLSLTASFTPDSAHKDHELHVFALAWVPVTRTAQGLTGRWFAKTSRNWIPLSVGQTWPVAMTIPPGQPPQPITLLVDDDLRSVMGTSVYVGYGVSNKDAASAAADMVANTRYRIVYTVNQSPSDTGQANHSVGLTPVNEQTLSAVFAHVQRMGDDPTGGFPPGTELMPVATTTAVGNQTAVNVSATTLQEAGVDEDDLVKTDGAFLYNLSTAETADRGSRNVLQRHRLNANTPQTDAPDTVVLPWGKGLAGSGFFLDTERNQAIALAQGGLSNGIHDLWFAPGRYWGTGVTEVTFVDTGRSWRVKRHMRLSGALIGSRRVDSTLYLLLRSYPIWPLTTPTSLPKADQLALDAAALLPTQQIDQGVAQPLVQTADCLVPRNGTDVQPSGDIITLVALDLASPESRQASRCFVGPTEAFYLSERNVYLATTGQTYALSGRFPVYSTLARTDIHQFSLNGLEMNYQGSGSVTGHLGFEQNRKSFRMGEHKGVLRVFTQTGRQFGGWVGLPVLAPAAPSSASVDTALATNANMPTESPGKLTVLNARNGVLETIGELPNARRPNPLGKPGEQLYASRFLGNRGYLVTYRLIDPLYVIDLTDPADPHVLGELEVSGYSDYLFPLSEHLLLGVGKEAISDNSLGDGRAAWYQGVKLSVIDLTDPTRPTEIAKSIIGKRGTDATVLHNHHGIALQHRPDSVRVALPVSLRETDTAYTTGRVNDFYGFTRNELRKFEVNVSARSLTQKPALVVDAIERNLDDDRAVIWNDQVHHFTGEKWRSESW